MALARGCGWLLPVWPSVIPSTQAASIPFLKNPMPEIRAMMDRRTLLALSLSFLLVVLYQVYMTTMVAPPPPATETATQESKPAAQVAKPAVSTPGSVAVGKGGETALAPAPASAAAMTPPSGAVVTFNNGVLEGKLALAGARLIDLKFLQYKDKLGAEGAPIAFLSQDPASFYFAESGFLAAVGINLPNRQTAWRLETPATLEGEGVIRLSWDNGQGLLFRKQIHLSRGSYLLQVKDSVLNQGATAPTLYPFTHLLRIAPAPVESASAAEDFVGPIGFLDGVRVQHPYDDIKKRDARQEGKQGWVGFNDKYFLSAIIPAELDHGKRYYFDYDAPAHRVGLVGGKVTLQPKVEVESAYALFMGPKAVKLLEAQHLDLERSIDYGWFHFLAQPLVHMLLFFHTYFGNFAAAIVLLTLIIKALFFPLADKSYRSMEDMKRLQPKMEELKQTYGEDKQRLQQEMMKLYQENKVNPLGGCLPIAVQIPVFFALYKVLLLSIELRHAPLGGWIQDLSDFDPYYILPVLMGISMYFQTRLSPTPADPMQAKVMQFLPVIFTFFFFQFPSGLVLYWLVNNLLSIAQQSYIMKRTNPKPA